MSHSVHHTCSYPVLRLHVCLMNLFHCNSHFFSNKQHHYAVREIGLRAKCNCNGYADGFDCSLNSVNNLRECKCKGNTCGVYCHMCCSAFNQYPWQQGNGAPWVWNGTATCEGTGNSDVVYMRWHPNGCMS